MSFVITDPDAMATAADELQGIGAELEATNASVAAPMTGVLAPGTDSVSVRTAAFLDAQAAQYQALSAQAELFHTQFVQTLITAKNAYAETEVANAAAMQPASQQKIALIMGGTGNPSPDLQYMTSIEQTYLAQNYSGYTLVSLHTPEEFWPVTGINDTTFGRSVYTGFATLNSAILSQTSQGNKVVVVGYSQSATIASLEMRYLQALPAALRPDSNLLNFVLLADPNNPMGGVLTHWIPGFGTFNWPTPLTTSYATSIFTLQYDAIADFPVHPLWLPSDINALFGYLNLHATMPYLPAAQVANAIQSQIGNLSFYFMPTTQLPLLDPLRTFIPILGNPLADLLQPFLKPIVDLGYAPGFLPAVNPLSVAGYVGQGATAGITNPLVSALPPLASNAVVSGF
ncbi:PE family protein [Mycobacterium lentiflavum]|uniref:PE family protein n=1 Tax=Mycobacterium lentiflavum TaxID=141349 RepID=A0A0E4H0B4_MYCLN|nr:PE-PPE domain-containing protein [Mycobacterium lentiflavum]CQD12208.1 PE family protein [Mycobacterium lentiflavum]